MFEWIIAYIHIYILIKKIANLLMKKPDNWFAMPKMWEKDLKKKEILIKDPTCLLEISLCDGFQLLYVQMNHMAAL